MEPAAADIEIRQVKPVKIGDLHRKTGKYRDGFVKVFRDHDNALVLTDDGEPLIDGAGRRVFVNAAWFAREMGIPKATFHNWLKPPPV